MRAAARQQAPEQGEFVIRNAYVMTMDAQPAICPRRRAREQGAIVAVGRGVQAPGAQAITAAG